MPFVRLKKQTVFPKPRPRVYTVFTREGAGYGDLQHTLQSREDCGSAALAMANATETSAWQVNFIMLLLRGVVMW